MASIYRSAHLGVPASVAWGVVDRYSRAEVHVFSRCTSERMEGEHRVVTTVDGLELWERNITVDPERRRAVYTVPDIPGAEHHQAEMRVDDNGDGTSTLVWSTDILPHELADALGDAYDEMFAELVAAVQRG